MDSDSQVSFRDQDRLENSIRTSQRVNKEAIYNDANYFCDVDENEEADHSSPKKIQIDQTNNFNSDVSTVLENSLEESPRSDEAYQGIDPAK